jgi:phosphoglycerate dehydrogenase-like enzyme
MAGVAVVPDSRPAMFQAIVAAVEAGGGTVVDPADADALIWADPHASDTYPGLIASAPGVEWIHLPYAGIEPFVEHLDEDHTWTCAKVVYADPVAEWVITALLTAFRDIPRFVRARSWPAQGGRNLLGARLTVLGGGGITTSLLRLLEPWGCNVTVVRRTPEPVPGATRTGTVDHLRESVTGTEALIVACSLTDATRGIVDADLLAAMPTDSWLINVARGGHVVTADLVAALERGAIAGAVLDVTDPEPLPDDSPLWAVDNCVLTPHVGNTPEMGLPLLAGQVRENVRRWLAGEPLLGAVDVRAGY